MPAAAQAVGPRYPTFSGWAVRSSPNRRPCSPARSIAAPRSCGWPPSLLVTATPASAPGAGCPAYLSRTLGRPARRVNDLPRRVAQELASGGPAASGCPSEVLRTDGVQELAELLDFVFLLVRDRHPGLVQDLLTGEDRCTGPERERDRVRRPGAHFLPVGEDEVGEEDAVPERGDVDRVQLHPECLEHVAKQVVGQRPGRHHPLLRERDRGGFHRADPDWQVPLPLHLLEQDDGLVRGHLHADADDLHLPHSGSVLTCAGPASVLKLLKA